jgi:ABC-type lipoprotein export system ATPase subunit
MNFVVDMTVYDFIRMHAESRMVADPTETAQTIIMQANLLAGEDFNADTPVTSLSGGQSRALMIADTAFLSTSPIVLIDEIENAGIDRKTALNLLVREEKIVMIATHDPLLALMGSRRIVIRNGGIREIIITSPVEQANLTLLEQTDRKMVELRNMIRSGKRIDFDINSYF